MLTSENMSPADIAAITNGNNGFGFGGEGGLFWLLVLFLFSGFNGGWGNNFGNGGTQFVDNSVQRGFDQSAIMNGINGLNGAITSGFGNVQTALCNGFAGVNAGMANGFAQAEISNNARQIADMNQTFAGQTAVLQGFNGVQGQLASLGADVAREACADRQVVSEAMMGLTAQNNANTNALVNTINGGIQSLKDQLCDYRNEQKDNTIAQLRSELMFARGQASQDVQTAAIQAGQRALANEVEQYIRPQINPSYIVPNPYGGCNCNNTGCCGV